LETHVWGVTISWNVMIPILVAPVVLLLVVLLLPFVEAWVTGDKREHHLLQRPRDAPTRTGFMAALVTFYGIAWAAGGNDIIAIKLHLSINQITYALRVLIFVGPVIAFLVAKRWCISLQRHDREMLLHGRETGVILRSPDGGYSEKHAPLSEARAYTLAAGRREQPIDDAGSNGANGANGVPRPDGRSERLRHRLSHAMFADNLPNLTAAPAPGSDLEHHDRPADRPGRDGADATTDGHA
jgi:ubiquinol-cytochrome c reductase cytochrome b subunit